MSIPSRPRYQQQGPDDNCIINGILLGWESCTGYSAAMGIDKSTLGLKRPSGCSVRRFTGDTSGGLMLRQIADVATAHFGVYVATYTGENVMKPATGGDNLRAGHGLVLQGNAIAMVGTKHQSTGGRVNHAVWVNEGRGWNKINGHWIPNEVLVYDPAADGRKAGWGTADQGPSWWSWSLLLKFAAALRPWGDNDSRLLGPGKWYVGVFPDTEPHAHFHFGGHRPPAPIHWPDRTRVVSNGTWTRSRPDLGLATRVHKLDQGALWEGWQYATGPEYQGSTLWLGNHLGTEWIHSKFLSHVGGAT